MNTDQANKDQLRLIRLPEVMERTGLARPTIYRAASRGQFPKPVKFGSATSWVAQEVDSWIRARMAERLGAAA
jgi:prophage regulatory protein